ncbi:MAG: class I SAM-dependent methyltransferase [Nostoc sp. NMS1]|uniref:class I SAM-dependent methyltransferase n=1 Tax=unclassified Nostoc TaxID=2593658 RepID=UPI0025DB035A|nr:MULTISPECIES: class I SAM-dependent methyltransferase [unclassified Nostoc]MBN3907024.1 class I SAM-dependent methyltransferase [Nostoc sp. NMS1]MBN3992068.1 class I SAM-dependent methyltransferase [Nostoc sp. NMS2]
MQLQHQKISTNKQRLNCSICDYRVDPNDESAFATFPSNVRAFKDEKFKAWRCHDCQTIHCLDIVDLDHYYAKYPYSKGKLTGSYRFLYSHLYRQLKKHGFSKSGSLLDYGCGTNALFVQYLQEQGFTNIYGYDPYGTKDGFGNPTTLQRGPFDYILLQDVIEHVEDPNALLSELNSLLAPGGYILIGTPNAGNIDLNRPDLRDYYNCVHAPYHLHIYTRETLESLGKSQGWEFVNFFDRRYDDTPWFSFNSRVYNAYASLLDKSLDVFFEPFKLGKALTSPKFLFYAIFGYWLSFHADMSIMFRKSL